MEWHLRLGATIKLGSGRVVLVEQVHIELSTLGVLEGSFETVRQQVLADLPNRARTLFPGTAGLSIAPVGAGELPVYTVFIALHSDEPLGDGDFSSLVHCWMTDQLPSDLPSHIEAAIRPIEWDRWAADGLV
ncbi:hypothetical protein [Variovorax sp. dw_954]|uniref:hypothetical protein n=1 Tax=Variovorax sp. dw_954 TaxID=2720078 RepID=UPI001BD2D9A5|nr:hypothetical protein [Variovorax sp. dw_954]